MHSCPHPLWQHFSLLGQSLSLEQNSAHSPAPQRLRGHTPGLAEGTIDINIYKWLKHKFNNIAFDWKGLSVALWTVHPRQFSHWEDLTKALTAAHLRKKFNIVARTESRRDTDSSTVKDTAFVVCRTVFITHTPLRWWDNIMETWAVAWFWRQWSRKGERSAGVTSMKVSGCQTTWLWNETDKHVLFFSSRSKHVNYIGRLNIKHISESKQTYLINCHQLLQQKLCAKMHQALKSVHKVPNSVSPC